MKNEDVKPGLVVITTVLKEEDPNCFYQFLEGRVPGVAGVVSKPVPGEKGQNLWLVVHTQGEEGAAYDSSEFEPFWTEGIVDLHSYFVKDVASNECCICGKSPTFGVASLFLSFQLGTHELVHFCEKHLNHVDVLRGIGTALTNRAASIANGITWKRDVLKEGTPEGKKPSYLVAIRAVDYDHFGCPFCCHQRPDVEFVRDTISLVWCPKCAMPYAVFADGVKKRSAMVEMLFGHKARAVLQERSCDDRYPFDWVRVFQCLKCSHRYPSDREGTDCDICGGKIRRSKVDRESKGAVDDCT